MEQPDLLTPIMELNERIKQTLMFFDLIDPSQMASLLGAFGKLRDAQKLINGMSDTIDSLYNKYSTEVIPNVLLSQEPPIYSIKVGDKLFSISTRTMASIPEDKRSAGHKWLSENGGAALIKSGVNSKQLSSFVTDYFNTYHKYPPKEAITVFLKDYTQVRST